MNANPIMMTVDAEGDWGGEEVRAIHEILPPLLELFDRYQVRSTFFVVANLIKHVLPLVPPESHHEVASHGLSHIPLGRLSKAGIRRELSESKKMLENSGYTVMGFRAPFLQCPESLPSLLEDAGYRYDASGGKIIPSLWCRTKHANNWQRACVSHLSTQTLQDTISPFSLTYLRLYHPFGLKLLPQKGNMFYFHLHELLNNTDGWGKLPWPFKSLHKRNCGTTAWHILETVLQNYQDRWLTCREFLTL